MRIGIFELVDPPEGMVDVVKQTLDNIDYPFQRTKRYLDQQDIDSIKIKWGNPDWMSNTTTGNWYAAENTIYLGTQFSGWEENVPFVLTHEIGHFIDRAVLTDRQRKKLMAVMHDHPDWSAPPIVSHDSQYMEHLEYWINGGAPYPAKIYECWADEFVAIFAPKTWEGHFPRFVHWSNDFDKIRSIVLNRRRSRIFRRRHHRLLRRRSR